MIRIFHSSSKDPVVHELSEAVAGAWLHVETPDDGELDRLSEQFKLDRDLLHDGVDPNESPRVERDGQTTYLFTRYTLPEADKQTTSPMLIIYTAEVVITICRRAFPGLGVLISGELQLSTNKRTQLILQILNEINSDYKHRINQASRRILQIRAQLDKAQIANEDFVAFIDIEEDLNDFLLVLEPMAALLINLLNGKFVKLYEEDRDLIEDLSLGTDELTMLAQSRLTTLRNIREAYSTITANNLNTVFKLMTAVTILFTLFTVVTGIYSMNMYLPGAHSHYSFWIVLGITSLICGWAAWIFHRKKWL